MVTVSAASQTASAVFDRALEGWGPSSISPLVAALRRHPLYGREITLEASSTESPRNLSGAELMKTLSTVHLSSPAMTATKALQRLE